MEPNTLSHLIDSIFQIIITYIAIEAMFGLLVIGLIVWAFRRFMD